MQRANLYIYYCKVPRPMCTRQLPLVEGYALELGEIALLRLSQPNIGSGFPLVGPAFRDARKEPFHLSG